MAAKTAWIGGAYPGEAPVKAVPVQVIKTSNTKYVGPTKKVRWTEDLLETAAHYVREGLSMTEAGRKAGGVPKALISLYMRGQLNRKHP